MQSPEGYWGVRVIGSSEEVFRSESGGVTVSIKDHDRELTEAQFIAQFTGCTFSLPNAVVEVGAS